MIEFLFGWAPFFKLFVDLVLQLVVLLFHDSVCFIYKNSKDSFLIGFAHLWVNLDLPVPFKLHGARVRRHAHVLTRIALIIPVDIVHKLEHPSVKGPEHLVRSDITNENTSSGIPEINSVDAPKELLPQCVPDLKLLVIVNNLALLIDDCCLLRVGIEVVINVPFN